MRCAMCNGRLVRRKAPFDFEDADFGEYTADVCARCGEAFFTPESSRAIDTKARELGLFGSGHSGKVSVSGRGLVLRIPVELARQLSLHKGQTVTLRLRGRHRFVVETA